MSEETEFKMRHRYYDRRGNPISLAEFVELSQNRKINYKDIKSDVINNHLVSTIWLGIDHSFFNSEKPLIFETMIFKIKDGNIEWDNASLDYYQKRYSTEEQALEGHKEAIKYVLDRVTAEKP